MLHIFFGSDEFRASEALRTLRSTLDADGMLSTNTTELTGRGLRPAELIEHASAMPFLGTVRLVIVDGLLTAVGSRRDANEAWQPFVQFAAVMPESSHVVLREPPATAGGGRRGLGSSALLKELREIPGTQVEEFRELRAYRQRGRPSEVEEWLQARAAAASIPIDSDAIELLADLIGANLRLLASELDKLRMYAGERPISSADVRLLTTQAREESIFAFVDAVVEGRTPLALRMLHQVLTDGTETPMRVQAMIARQVRHLLRAAEVLSHGGGEGDVAEATGLRRGFPLTKTMRQARSSEAARIEAALRAIEHSDNAVKTGALTDTIAIELLVEQVSTMMRPERGRGAARRR